MKQLITYIFPFLIMIILFSCKSEQNSTEVKVTDDIASEIKASDPDVIDARSRASEKLTGVSKSGLYADLTSNYWQFDVVVKGTGMVDTYKGHWYQFKDDQTYIKGKYAESIESGRWNYNPTKETLCILPASEAEMPLEFKLMAKASTIICIGTPDFGNNDTQMKWIKADGPSTPDN